jgi:two-component system sensor histidine kinase KdpD
LNPQNVGRGKASRHALAVGACVLTTLLALPLLGRVDLANIVLLFVLAVVMVATFLGRWPAVLASFIAVACFDFFFVPPRFSFTVAHFQYLITFAVMLVVSLVISHLTNAYREKALEEAQRATESALLHELAQALAGAPTLQEVVDRLDAICRRLLDADAALFVPGENGTLAPAGTTALPIGYVERTTVQGVFANGLAVHASPELQDRMVTALYPLEGSTCRRGVLAIHRDARQDALEPRLLSAIAAVVATAVERVHFVDVAQSTAIEMQAERLRGAILSSISHDLRTPLTVLYGQADALARGGGLDAEQQASADSLREQSRRLHRMVDNLLDMARLRSGRIELRRDWQSIPELVAAAARGLAPWLEAGRLRFDWPAGLPLVEADGALMDRVFSNLLENAVKYSPPGTPIAIGAHVENADGKNRVRIWFDNAGDGFPHERCDRMFEAFTRGPAESALPGVGLGLSVCRAIVDSHGGRIEASNPACGGARVTIELPLNEAPTVPAEGDGS